MTYVQDIARYVHGLTFDAVPAPVLQRVRACWLYNLSQALASNEADDPIFTALLRVFDAPGACAVLGAMGQRRAAADAAALNAALIATRGQNDTHRKTVTHLGCVILPAVLAIAQERKLGAREAMLAALAGYEVVPKIARGAATASTARGFRATSLYSLLGAAAACSRALGLAPEQTAHALAIAANLAGGLLQCWEENTPEWRLQLANASRAGVQAARLAEQGMQAATLALEGPNGFYRAFAGSVPPLQLSGWDILDVVFKPYPGCAFNQSSVHTLRAMLRDEQIAPAAVKSIRIAMNPHDAQYPGVVPRKPVDSISGALMSAAFMAAVTLRDGAPRWRHFTREYTNPELLQACERIRVVADPELQAWQCEVQLELIDGSRRVRRSDGTANFAWEWDETVAETAALAAEWPFTNATQRHRQLAALLSGFGADGSIAELVAVCAA